MVFSLFFLFNIKALNIPVMSLNSAVLRKQHKNNKFGKIAHVATFNTYQDILVSGIK